MEDKLNTTHALSENRWQGSRRFYGKSDFEKSKTGSEDLKRELENLAHLSNEASRKYSHHRATSGFLYTNLENK